MFEWILTIPASIKIGCIFVLILLLYRLTVPLSVSILLNALLLCQWSGGGLAGLAYQVRYLLEPESVLLVTVIVLLLTFTESLSASGKMERTINALKAGLRRPRVLFAGLPALIGLLPMPGGAVFSAPMVGSLDEENRLEPPLKVAVNYWFRHIWEYWWPLYPGVVLAIKYSGLPIAGYIAIQFPLTLFSVLGGYLFILRRIPGNHRSAAGDAAERRGVAAALLPIVVLILLSVGGSYLMPLAGVKGTLASVTAMLIGLVVALTIVFASAPASLPKTLRTFARPTIWTFVVLVVGVQAFSAALKRPLDAGGLTLVAQMRDEFMVLGIPLVAVMMAIPLVSGAVTGVAMGFVGASFPLVFALIGPNPPLHEVLATTTLAYGFGYIGMTLSPVHICLVVTNQYFKTRMFSSYRYILGPLAAVAAGVLLLAGTYYVVFR